VEELATVFEVAMLIGFGASWPFAVARTWRTKNVVGLSPVYLWCILLGYVSGVLFKIFGRLDAVIALYALNGTLVATEIALYYRFRERRPGGAV
jgi:hypothetical protein